MAKAKTGNCYAILKNKNNSNKVFHKLEVGIKKKSQMLMLLADL